MDAAGKVILPPGFRKSDRRERLLPSNPIPIVRTQSAPSPHPAAANSRLQLPIQRPPSQPSPLSNNAGIHSASNTDHSADIEDPHRTDRSARPPAKTQPISPAPVPNGPRNSLLTPPVAQSPSNHSQATPSSPDNHSLLRELGAVDDVSRAQLHEWYLRSGSMEQGLRDLKKRRDRK